MYSYLPNEWAGFNKRGGWQNCQYQIKGQGGRMEHSWKTNKWGGWKHSSVISGKLIQPTKSIYISLFNK